MRGFSDSRVGFYLFVGLCIVAVAISIAEICVVRYDLWKTYTTCYNYWSWCQSYSTTCLLGSNAGNLGPCYYAYAVGGVSLIFSAMLGCFAHNRTLILNVFIAIFGLGWWLAGAIVITTYTKEANADHLPKEGTRQALLGLCWTNVAMFGLCVAATAYFWYKNRYHTQPPQGAPTIIYQGGVQMQPPPQHYAPPNTYQYNVPPPGAYTQHAYGGGFAEPAQGIPVQGYPVYPPPAGGYPPPVNPYGHSYPPPPRA